MATPSNILPLGAIATDTDDPTPAKGTARPLPAPAKKPSDFSFSSIEHKLASGFTYIVKGLKYVETSIIPTIEAESPVIEGLTGLVSPKAETIERAAFAALGQLLAPVQASEASAAQDGLSVTLDGATVASYKAFLAEFKGDLAQVGISL